jgi:hypothetical protein
VRGITQTPSEPAAIIVGSFFLSCRFVSTFGSYGRVFAFPAGTRRDAGGQIKISGLGNAAPFVTQSVPNCQQDFKFIFWAELAPAGSVEICVTSCATVSQAMKRCQTLKARASINVSRGFNNLADQRGESDAVMCAKLLVSF